jgi:glutamyl-tRNA synthetase
MKKGTPEGLRWCIRAKISADDKNKVLYYQVYLTKQTH